MNTTNFKKELLEEKGKVEREIKELKDIIKNSNSNDIIESFDDADFRNQKMENIDIKNRLEATLKDINNALLKISKNKYGKCENCKKQIEDKRLKMYPTAKYCMHCVVKFEK